MHRGFMGSIFIIEEKCGENPAGTKVKYKRSNVYFAGADMQQSKGALAYLCR